MTKSIMLLSLFISTIVTSNLFSQKFNKPPNTLPVELTYFVGDVVDTVVELRWGTATEVNNYGYDILRADTSLLWTTIGFVQGHGNSFSPKDYIFTDSTLNENGKYFYLLKQIDFDGNYELTNDTVKVMVDFVTSILDQEHSENLNLPDKFKLFQNYPNPFNPTTIISFELKKSNLITLNIYSSNGQFVESIKNGLVSSGTHYIKFNANNLSSGTYIYKLTVGNNSFSKKMLLIK